MGRRRRERRTDAAAGPRVPAELVRFDPGDWPGLTAEQAAAQFIADRERFAAAHGDGAGRSPLGDLTDLFVMRRESRLLAARRLDTNR